MEEVVKGVLCFASGVLSKIEDMEGWKAKISGVINGILLYILAITFSLQNAVVGGLLGVLLAGKIDKESHFLSTSVFLILYCLTPRIIDLTTIIFAIGSYADERMSERKDLFGKRIFLPLTCGAYTLLTGSPLVLYIMAFDAGYNIVKHFSGRKKEESEQP